MTGRLSLLPALLLASLPAFAQTTGYGPSAVAPDAVTAPAAVQDVPGGPSRVQPGVDAPSPVTTSAAAPTLAEALGTVYETNPLLLSERAHLRAIDENVPIALSGWRPQVSVTVSPGYGYGTYYARGLSGPTAGVDNSRFSQSEQVNLTQPIYRGGKTAAATAQAENQVRAERGRLLAQEELVFADTVSAFVTVIEDQQLYALQVSNVQVLSKQLEATNARFGVGEITRTDVAQAQAALAGAIAQRETALGNLQTARATYRRQVGDLPDKLIEPQPLALPVHSAEEADTLASVNNPNVVAALYDDATAKDAIDTAYSALMPTVALQTGYGYSEATAVVGSRTIGGTVVGVLTVPLYQGGAEYATIRQAKQTEQQYRRTADDARRVAVQQATQTWEQYAAARATIVSTRAQIVADEVALDGVEREALVGTATTLDVLNAEILLLNARVTLIQNLATLVNASYDVADAIGRLTARDLGLRVALYDETAYYRAVRDRWGGDSDEATHQPGR